MYELPSKNILTITPDSANQSDESDKISNVVNSVFSNFEIDARVDSYTRGPAVTRYDIAVGKKTKVSKILGLRHDISYSVGNGNITIISPVPGKSAIGIEIPNVDRGMVTLGDAFDISDDEHPLTIVVGKDINGTSITANLAKMPHLLVAGSTGSGKSVFINSLINSILMRTTPEQVRMVLIDPKRVELSSYVNIPHLATPIVTDPNEAAYTLGWVVEQMDKRYTDLALSGYRHLDDYNRAIGNGSIEGEKYPYLLVVIDELADLMMVAGRDVEASIVRITQLARAAGIHLVVATQRPSVDVLTGLIKANMPSRLAFAVSSTVDSRVILDQRGAESLTGKGDSLFLPMGAIAPLRVQGAWISDPEIDKIISHVESQPKVAKMEGDVDITEAMINDAVYLIHTTQYASTAMLERRLSISRRKAKELLDLLEARNIVSNDELEGFRSVLV